MSPESRTVQEVTRRLVGREAGERAAPDAAAARDACECAHRELCRWVGADGCYALFNRALAGARRGRPALEGIHFRAPSEQGSGGALGGITGSVEAYGAGATATGLEALLAAVVESLGRLIGGDLAVAVLQPCLWNAARRGDDRECTS